MWVSFASFSRGRKLFLLASFVGLNAAIPGLAVGQNTFTNADGGAGQGGNFWNRNDNWAASLPPTSVETAVIPAGVSGVGGGSVFITDAAGSLSTSAFCGTLLIATDDFTYARIRASNGTLSSGQTATITFGTGSLAGGLDLNGDRLEFTLGDSGGLLIGAVPRHLNARLLAGGQLDSSMHLTGSGSVAYSR